MRALDVPQKGARGNTVASRNRFGQFLRERVSPNQPATAAQRAAWANMTALSRLWNELGQARRNAWRTLAATVHSRPSLNHSGPLDACQLFKKLNRVLATCGRAPLLDPPPLPVFAPNPVVAFTIRDTRRGLAFKLLLSPTSSGAGVPPVQRGPAFKLLLSPPSSGAGVPPVQRRRPSTPLLSPAASPDTFPAQGDLMVYSGAPFNPGADKNDLYAFIGLMPTPVGGESDITSLYLAKLKQWRKLKPKRYHIPLEGSRIFIRVWQQINGWVKEVGMFQTSALVPANWGRLRISPHRGTK